MNGDKGCDGCWRGQAKDGTWVMYRPPGNASEGTRNSTGTVEISNKSTINLINAKDGKPEPLKLKFPLKGAVGIVKP